MSSIRCAVLTVSDRAFQDASHDTSGPLLKTLLIKQGFICNPTAIVPDEVHKIRRTVMDWAYRTPPIDLILTTGGTGFGVRDQTPEAIEPLLERKAPGISHLLLSASLQHTPMAALSRPVAGTIQRSMLITFPGSEKAVKENFEALTKGGVLNHALELIRGGDGKPVHDQLAADRHHGHHEHHHHHHHHHETPQPRTTLSHDLTAPVSSRHRVSPYPLLTLADALEQIHQHIKVLPSVKLPVTSNLRGYVLAEDIFAPQDLPTTSTSNVDGYAIKATNPPGIYRVLSSETLSPFGQEEVPAGHIYRINTGGALPLGTDSVIMVEDTEVASVHQGGEEAEVRTLTTILAGENVRLPGSDVREGELVLEKDVVVNWWGGGGEVGMLAFVGRKETKVYKKPVVALLSTGNELVDLHSSGDGEQDLKGKEASGIWDTNRPALQAALEGMGYQVIDLGIVGDSVSAHQLVIAKGLDKADILITTGGTSMGPSDLLKPVLEQHFSGTIHFGRVSVKPGKPTTFATIPFSEEIKPVFALPGNPASALVTFYIFVVPALRILGGYPQTQVNLPLVRARMVSSVRLDLHRIEFHRVIVSHGNDGQMQARSVEGSQRSSRVGSLCGANGFAVLPPKGEGLKNKVDRGEVVEVFLIGEISAVV